MVRLDAALKVKDAADVDDQAAEEAADALEQAIEGLVRDVDRTRLESALDTAGDLLETELEKHYTSESWNALKEAYEAASKVCADHGADQDMIDRAAGELESSISGLEKRTVIKELEDLVSQAEKLDPSLYTEDSWERVQTALDAARAVLADPDAAQADCDNAQEALEEAMDALEYLPGGAEMRVIPGTAAAVRRRTAAGSRARSRPGIPYMRHGSWHCWELRLQLLYWHGKKETGNREKLIHEGKVI